MTEIAGETQTKNGEKTDKEYSIECDQDRTTIRTYKGEIRDRKILNWVPFIGRFGVIATKVTGWLNALLGAIIYLGSFKVFFGYIEKSEEFTGFLICILGSVVGLGIHLIGDFLIYNVNYVKATRCERCHMNYAYEEREEPDIKEASTEDSYNVTITRYWKCKHCGFMDSSESPEKIKAHKGTKGKPKEIKCKKCGKIGINSEYRNPDVKKESFPMIGPRPEGVINTTRYYKCIYCGNLNTTEEEMEIRANI
ncbi:hypothetical protein FXV91_13005 [Methanosarcina sp. DH2]|uniref:hypothetical protein n=1 Tax=Methanosarcina sp. DH2 TaxID=2605639 RepID=UPI001E3E4229|nr:hypothetical protein [Methanosarcina sp. DH2]MCC4771051.1 hypothetical protein [Methanosarcina sp. DH2]